MTSRATRILINLAAVVVVAWIGFVVYESVQSQGLWREIAGLLSDNAGASPAAVFSACVMLGVTPIGALAWVVWRLFLRGRADKDFPTARAQSRERD